jgi:hypothetical protein
MRKTPKYIVRPSDFCIFEIDEDNGCYRVYYSNSLKNRQSAYPHFSYENLVDNYGFFPISESELPAYEEKHNFEISFITWKHRNDGHGGCKGGTREEYMEHLERVKQFNKSRKKDMKYEPLKYDPENRNTYHFVDDYGMMLVDEPEDYGRGDSIKRTFLAWFCYQKEELYKAILQNVKEDGKRIRVNRHPERLDDTMSRDHLTFLFAALKLKGDTKYLKSVVRKLPWKISDRFNQTIDFWLWSRVLAGNFWLYPIYSLVMATMMGAIAIWNNTINLIAGYNREQSQEDYVNGSNSTLTRWQFHCKSARVPSFVIYYHIWQIYVLPNGIFKRALQFIASLCVHRYNWVLKLLTKKWNGPTVKDLEDYKPMSSNRWTAIMNETNTWDLHVIKDPQRIESNVLDKDLFYRLMQIQNKI